MTLHPFRSIRRSPGTSLAVMAMLAGGASVLTLAFTLLDGALFRPPGFPAVDRLVMVYTLESGPRRPETRLRWSFPRIQMLREYASETIRLANYSAAQLTLTHDGTAELLDGEVASADYFPVLGATALLGRTFLTEEDLPENPRPVVVLGYGLWQSRFGGDPGILGRTIRINRRPLTVVGVLDRAFGGLSGKAQLWVPAAMAPHLTYPGYLTSDQHFISVVGRLRDGVTLERARERLRAAGERIEQALPEPDAGRTRQQRAAAVPLNEARINPVMRRSLVLLFSAAALLYLLALANAVNLLLGRAVSRRREAAILLAVGASTWQRARHFALEAALLGGAGSILGVGLAWLAAPLVQLPPDLWGPRTLYGSLSGFAETTFGPRSLGFGVALAAVTALLTAWPPTLTLLAPGIAGQLRGAAGPATAGASRVTLRGIIVSAEAALATILLLAGALLLDSVRRMRATDLGVRAQGVLTFWVRPPEARVPPEQAPAFVERLLAEIARVPGVEAVTVDGGAPVSGSARSTLILADRPAPDPADAPPILRHYVAPDHFRVLGVPLIRGRVFNAGDVAGRPRVAIISRTAATRFWPGGDPIGRRIWFGGGSDFDSPERSAEIVGIVGDVVHQPLDAGTNLADFYTPYQQFTYASRAVMLRTSGDPLALVGPVREAVGRVDPDLPLVEVQSLTRLIEGSWARQRFDALILGGLAAVALLLAAAGVYAVVAAAVGQRTREIGIRMALGARSETIMRLVLREGMAAPLWGLALGGLASVAVTRMLRGVLYQVSPGDPRILALTGLLLLGAAALACWLPARRATRVDPLIALRAE